jgi:hypothetical protein
LHKRIPISLLLLLGLAAKEVPNHDPRRDSGPHTKTHCAPRRYDSPGAWHPQRDQVRRQVLTSSGLWPMPARAAVPAKSFGTEERNGFIVDKLQIETLHGFFVGANPYRPMKAAPRSLGVLAAHGHWKNGCSAHSKTYPVPALCAALASNGYVALAFDMVGYGDTPA